MTTDEERVKFAIASLPLPSIHCRICGGKFDVEKELPNMLVDLPEPMRSTVPRMALVFAALSGAKIDGVCDNCDSEFLPHGD